ncbi:MAG: PIN domain nuclease [Nocardioidaceae bacterium]
MNPAHWLVDKSVLARLAMPEVSSMLWEAIVAGTVGVSIITELEMGFSARSAADYLRTRRELVDQLLPIALPVHAEARARHVQAALVDRGQHRAVGVADLLIAATAELEGLTVLHYDADFETIADVTRQPVEWVVPRGSL